MNIIDRILGVQYINLLIFFSILFYSTKNRLLGNSLLARLPGQPWNVLLNGDGFC